MNTLVDKENNLMSEYTEGNVRFFLGEQKRVNASIVNTAKDPKKLDQFWAMNNGLTIIGENIVPVGGNTYSIQNPQIVNGCQTVHCLYQAFKEQEYSLSNNLKVFVKLVETNNLDIQTDIISATNSQNAVKSASLKANDDVQKNIETLLRKNQIYYERRENFYKRQGYSGSKVITLMKMAQIINTVVNKSSIESVNDVSSLFNDEKKYNSIFSNKADFDLYLFSTRLYQRIWNFKNSDIRTVEYDDASKRDLVSKGGFVFLHILSSLLFSHALFDNNNGRTSQHANKPFRIDLKKNEFTIRKTWLFETLEDEYKMKALFKDAKNIFFQAANNFANETSKAESSLFKARNFDKQFLRTEIDRHLEASHPTLTLF